MQPASKGHKFSCSVLFQHPVYNHSAWCLHVRGTLRNVHSLPQHKVQWLINYPQSPFQEKKTLRNQMVITIPLGRSLPFPGERNYLRNPGLVAYTSMIGKHLRTNRGSIVSLVLPILIRRICSYS